MKVVRRITYEVPDEDHSRRVTPEERLRMQMEHSLMVGGPYEWLTNVTVEHLEGPRWDTDGSKSLGHLLKSETSNPEPKEK